MTNNYPNPAAFRQALKVRIKRRADQRDMLYNRYRQLVLFERFAARVYEACGSDVLVKGGLVMEFRFDRARATRDIDVLIEGRAEERLDAIRRVAVKSGDDWLAFEFGQPEEVVEHEGDQIAYGAYRVDVQAKIGGKSFGDPFHFDISSKDRVVTEPEVQSGTDLFEFVGIEPLEHRIYPREAHVAEKLHAWSLPRDRPNSRVKDLVDLGLMADGLKFEAKELRKSIEATFEFRETHPVPDQLPNVPESWPQQYQRHRDENPLSWETIGELTELVEQFLEPMLVEQVEGRWSPDEQEWRSAEY